MERYAFIWDLDGTLVDSYALIVPKVQKFCGELGIRYSENFVKDYVIRYSVGKLFDEIAPFVDKDPDWLKEQYDILNDQGISGIKAMPYAGEILEKLKAAGHTSYIFTHRGSSCQTILEQTGLAPYFTEIVTARAGFARKPAADGILYLLEKYKLPPENCFYVGDRSIDIQSGNNAGIGTILFLPEGSPVEADGSQTHVIHELKDIEKIMEDLK